MFLHIRPMAVFSDAFRLGKVPSLAKTIFASGVLIGSRKKKKENKGSRLSWS